MFWSSPPCERQGSLTSGDEYEAALMSFGTYVHGWYTSNPSWSSSAPVSRGSLPGTRFRESVQTAPTLLPAAVSLRSLQLVPPFVDVARNVFTGLPELAPLAVSPGGRFAA